jgi:hypothetical protein
VFWKQYGSSQNGQIISQNDKFVSGKFPEILGVLQNDLTNSKRV